MRFLWVCVGLAVLTPVADGQPAAKELELQARLLGGDTTLLAGETISHLQVELTLINHTTVDQDYLPFDVARKCGLFDVIISSSDGIPVRRMGGQLDPKPTKGFQKLGSAQSMTVRVPIGYPRIPTPGTYQIKVTLETLKQRVSAKPIEVTVAEVPNDAILSRITLSRVGYEAAKPELERQVAVVDQIKIGDKIALFYRVFNAPKWGGKISHAMRLATLDKPVTVLVVGAYGDEKPVVVAFPHSPRGLTLLTVNSVDGTIEKVEYRGQVDDGRRPPGAEAGSDRVIPPPRPIKP
jgi:hypothetical protein